MRWWALFAVAAAGTGCTAKPTAAPPPAYPVVVVTPTIITPHDDESPTDTFQRARGLLLEGKAAEAAPIFDRLAASGTSAEMSQVARFNAGVAWEQTGDRNKALERFRDVIEHYPAGDAGKWGGIRAARIQAYLEQWTELSSMADVLLVRGDLSDIEHLEAYGSKALAMVEVGDADGAERFVMKGRDIIDSLRLGEGGKLPLEVAQIHFALGEIRRLRSEAITFVPVPANFAEVLERRCQGLLDAQSAYSDAMRSYDAHWAAMSGYRIGALYQHLHQDVIGVPAPKSANTSEKRQLFEGAMRLRYRILLQKGLTMMEHTIMLGERTGEASPWIDRAREAKRDLEKSLLEQKSALAKLPYTEKELQRALDDLAKKTP
jgi:hypothetical protein